MVDPLLAGMIGVVLLVVFLFSGLPIAVSLGFSGMLGILLAEGVSGAFIGIGQVVFDRLWSLSLLPILFFVFMGNLVTHHKIGVDLYDAVFKWLGWLPGGLAIASTVMSALFGFMCGSGIGGTATIGGVAIPEMENKGYDRKLALGTLALAGSLSTLIPPSVLMLIYASETEVSVGWLFFAGIFPGLLLTALMSIYILARARLNPSLAPPGPVFPLSERAKSLVHLIPVFIMFLVVLGGIYMGVWSPMEAGAGGCLIALLISLGYRRVKWSAIKAAAIGTTRTCVMIYILITGAGILSLMFYVSGLNEIICQAVVGLALPRWGTILLMLVILMIMGCFMDVIAMLLISLPIFLPIILALGYDPVWFGIIMIVSSEMALITPPVGIHLFVIQGIAPKGTTLMDVALGALPFVGILWVLLVLLLTFPQIVMWLPMTMRGG